MIRSRILFALTFGVMSMPLHAEDVTFAGGRAQVPLPRLLTVVSRSEGLVATFGEGGTHRLEISLTGQLDPRSSSKSGVNFVADQASRKGIKPTRSRNRIVFMEPAGDHQRDGMTFRVVHWQIGTPGCVFTMTVTAPMPMSRHLEAFLRSPLNDLVNGVNCVAL